MILETAAVFTGVGLITNSRRIFWLGLMLGAAALLMPPNVIVTPHLQTAGLAASSALASGTTTLLAIAAVYALASIFYFYMATKFAYERKVNLKNAFLYTANMLYEQEKYFALATIVFFSPAIFFGILAGSIAQWLAPPMFIRYYPPKHQTFNMSADRKYYSKENSDTNRKPQTQQLAVDDSDDDEDDVYLNDSAESLDSSDDEKEDEGENHNNINNNTSNNNNNNNNNNNASNNKYAGSSSFFKTLTFIPGDTISKVSEYIFRS